MLRQLLVSSVVVLASSMALAAHDAKNSTSEFYHNPEAGKFEITPAIRYTSTSIDFKNHPSGLKSAEQKGWGFGINGEYAFNEMHTVGLTLAQHSWATETEPALANDRKIWTQGLMDPAITYDGQSKMDSGALHWGATLTLAMEKMKTDINSNTNAATGGTALTPYIGYDTKLSNFNVGGQLSFDLYKSDRSNSTEQADGTSVTSKTKEGNEFGLTAFGEMPINDSLVGLSLGYLSTAATKTETSGTTTDNKNAHSTVTVALYGSHHVAPTWEILPTFSYSTLSYNDSANADSYDSSKSWFLNIGARHQF